MPPAVTDLRAYIEDNSIPEPNTGCWIWMLSFNIHGYGQSSAQRRHDHAHRISFRAHKGPIPPGLLVRHSCDSRWCVAPHHLDLGTKQDNSDDKMRRGRGARKLTPDDVRFIRSSSDSHASLARKYNVDPAIIPRIKRRTAWRSIA